MPDKRLYENLRLFFPDVSVCKGWGQIPEIKPIEQITVDRWMPFSAANSRELNESVGVHMFLHDFQFERLWNKPTQYIQMLQAAGAICSPDFSMYTDTPTALNIYNHYRKHWLGAYWQLNGITVIPTICWADRESFGWCFDGEPSESIVAVSSIGVMRDQESRRLFISGYREMMERLSPKMILFMGRVPEGCVGNIVPMPVFTDQIQKRNRVHEQSAGS